LSRAEIGWRLRVCLLADNPMVQAFHLLLAFGSSVYLPTCAMVDAIGPGANRFEASRISGAASIVMWLECSLQSSLSRALIFNDATLATLRLPRVGSNLYER